MPTAVDYVLEGLARYLEVARETGVRAFEFDRAFLKELPVRREERPAPAAPAPAPAAARAPASPAVTPASEPASGRVYDFVFLHHAALDAAGVEMMAKIIGALGRTAETAPVLFTGELPAAKAYVVLGSLALAKWFPGLKGRPGEWLRREDGVPVLVTYSPGRILCFKTVTPAVMEMKRGMWQSIKSVERRIAG